MLPRLRLYQARICRKNVLFVTFYQIYQNYQLLTRMKHLAYLLTLNIDSITFLIQHVGLVRIWTRVWTFRIAAPNHLDSLISFFHCFSQVTVTVTSFPRSRFRLLQSLRVYSVHLSFCYFPTASLLFAFLAQLHPLVSPLPLSSYFWPSTSLIARTLHCFDVWPNYLVNWGSCSCHADGWWRSEACCLYSASTGQDASSSAQWADRKTGCTDCQNCLLSLLFMHFLGAFLHLLDKRFYSAVHYVSGDVGGCQVCISSQTDCFTGACLLLTFFVAQRNSLSCVVII